MFMENPPIISHDIINFIGKNSLPTISRFTPITPPPAPPPYAAVVPRVEVAPRWPSVAPPRCRTSKAPWMKDPETSAGKRLDGNGSPKKKLGKH